MKRQNVVRILGVAFAFACVAEAGLAQTQPANATPPAGGEGPSAAAMAQEASNPFAASWLMQIQQNNNWVEMPFGEERRVQSNLQFQPLLSVRLTENWPLIMRPVLTMVNSLPTLDENGQGDRTTGFGDTVLGFAHSAPVFRRQAHGRRGADVHLSHRVGATSSARTRGRSGPTLEPCCSSGT